MFAWTRRVRAPHVVGMGGMNIYRSNTQWNTTKHNVLFIYAFMVLHFDSKWNIIILSI